MPQSMGQPGPASEFTESGCPAHHRDKRRDFSLRRNDTTPERNFKASVGWEELLGLQKRVEAVEECIDVLDNSQSGGARRRL